MPTIIYEGGTMTAEQKKDLVAELTKASETVTSIPKQFFSVIIHENSEDNMGVGGETVTEIKKKMAANQ